MSDTNQSFDDRKVILFLSVDIIGSTSFKNKSISQLEWLSFFTEFYKQFPLFFLKNLEDQFNSVIPEKPEIWKSLGDELIFTVPINNHEEARKFVIAFSNSVFKYPMNNELTLKGTAWIAGFPVINAIISSDYNEDKKNIDYIGPQIDIGFRLCKFATNLKFIISVELLLIITKTTSSELNIFLDEPESLKGVLGNKPYPIIWIKNLDSSDNNLNKLLNRYEITVNSNKLWDYCKEFIEKAGKPFMVPFLKNDSNFSEKPIWYDEEYDKLKSIGEPSQDASEENIL